MQVKQLKQCKVCLKYLLRIQDGYFNYKDKRWVDDKGAQWNGLKCPDCVRSGMKIHQQKVREGQNHS